MISSAINVPCYFSDVIGNADRLMAEQRAAYEELRRPYLNLDDSDEEIQIIGKVCTPCIRAG